MSISPIYRFLKAAAASNCGFCFFRGRVSAFSFLFVVVTVGLLPGTGPQTGQE
jgi:hypothetical protein